MFEVLQYIQYVSDVSGIFSLILLVFFMIKSPELMLKSIVKMIRKGKHKQLLDELNIKDKVRSLLNDKEMRNYVSDSIVSLVLEVMDKLGEQDTKKYPLLALVKAKKKGDGDGRK